MIPSVLPYKTAIPKKQLSHHLEASGFYFPEETSVTVKRESKVCKEVAEKGGAAARS